MKISLVNVRRSEKPVLPLGLLYLAGVLERNGYQVKINDLVFTEDEGRFLSEIADYQPDIVGFSFLTTAVTKTAETVKKVRNVLKDKIIVGGGPHCTGLPRESLIDLGFDYVFYGEGEMSFLSFCKAIEKGSNIDNISGLVYKKDNAVKINPVSDYIVNLDELPLPSWHLIKMENYLFPPGYIKGIFFKRTAPVMTSRGCPSLCTFCSSPNIFGRKVRRRSVENVLQEIKFLIQQYKIDGIFFLDDTFTTSSEWVKNFCSALINEKMKIPWSCQTRVNVVTKPLLELMKNAGCVQVDFGIESGSDKILKNLKKGITVEQVKNAFKIAKEVGLRTYGSILIGSPGETWDDVIMTKNLISEIKPSLILFNFLTPFPGSELYDIAVKNKWLTPEKGDLYAYDTRKADAPIMSSFLTATEARKARTLMQNRVFFTNYLGYLSFRNFVFIFELFIACLFHPLILLSGMKKALRNRGLDDLMDTVYYIYCRKKTKQS